jgi:hypothetical protein
MRPHAISCWLLAAALWTGFTPAAAQVAVRAYVTPGNTVGVGRAFVLNVEVSGTQSLAEEPNVPDLAAFAQYLGSSSQSSVQMVNGRTSVSITVQYRYQALREGTYEIPSFTVDAGGTTQRTEPLRLTVAASPPAGQGERAADGGVPADELFLTAEATKTRVRDGEPFVVEYRIWTLVDVASYEFTRLPEPEGFWVEDVTPQGQPEVERITRNGRSYTTAVIRRVALVPSGAGQRTLEPVGLGVQVRVRRQDAFGDIFGSPFSSVVQSAVLSNPVRITVDPLPAGRPEPFSGIVGRLELEATIDRDSVAANEAVTLTLRASGEGNLRAVPTPDLGLPPDFEVFPPEITESVEPFGPGLTGEKTFEYVVIPRAPGAREIPAIAMGYFDERAGAYRRASTRALPLTVSGTAFEGASDVGRGGVALLREDIRFIRLGSDALRRRDRTLFGPAFWVIAFLPVLAVAGSVALRRHWDLLEGDVGYARGRRASGLARKRLAEARKLAQGTDARAFYAEVARALRGLVADRLNVPEAGLQVADVVEGLARRNVPEPTVAEVRACLEHCDVQRFAPPGTDPQEKSRFLDRVGAVMTTVDKAVR